MRTHPDASFVCPIDHDFEVLAEGMVNPWGADFNEFGDLLS